MRVKSKIKELALICVTGIAFLHMLGFFSWNKHMDLARKEFYQRSSDTGKKVNFQMYEYDTDITLPTEDTEDGKLYDLSVLEMENKYPRYSNKYIASFERFDVGMINLTFLKEFKTPCWLEQTNKDNFTYSNSRMITGPKFTKKNCFKDGLKKSRPLFIQLPGITEPQRLRCLPHFMLLGVAKSGTSDMQYRLRKSGYVSMSFSKELYWWNQYRFNPNATLSDYSDLLDFGLKDMVKLKEIAGERPYYPGILGEMTSITLSDVSYWRQDPRNRGLKEPKYLTPHDLYGVLPQVRLLVLMRNPTARLYSHYNMWASARKVNKSAEDFHLKVVNSIAWWKSCIHILPERGCLYGSPPEMPEVEHTLSSWWPRDRNYTGELRTGLYYFFLKDWLTVFPRESFIFIKSEEYSVDKLGTITKVLEFLGVPPLIKEEVESVEKMENVFQVTYEKILPETKELLDEFYQPFNQKLADLLGNSKWTWQK